MNGNRNATAAGHGLLKAVSTTLAAVVTATTMAVPCRAQAAPPTLPIDELEKTFWACDHAATRGAVDFATAALCSSATESLKLRKFGGDFDLLLAWWRQHKDERHLALDHAAAAARVTAARR